MSRIKFVDALTSETNNKLFTCWQNNIAAGEILSSFFFPISGYEYRIDNFLEYQKRNGFCKSFLLDLNLHTLQDQKDFITYLSRVRAKSILVKPANKLLDPIGLKLFHTLIEWSRSKHRAVILFFEIFPTTITSEFVYEFQYAFQKQFIFPMLDKQDTGQFVAHLENKWNKKTYIDIIALHEETGGHTWLIKEIIRQMIFDNHKFQEVLESREYKFKAQTIIDNLPEDIKKSVIDYANKKNMKSDNEHLICLEEMRILNSSLPKRTANFIFNRLKLIKKPLQTTNKRLVYDNVDFSNHFSGNELLLISTLALKSNELISRESLAKVLWPNESYNDWAFDKVISRVRKKFDSIGIDKNILRVKRGKGVGIFYE